MGHLKWAPWSHLDVMVPSRLHGLLRVPWSRQGTMVPFGCHDPRKGAPNGTHGARTNFDDGYIDIVGHCCCH